MSEGNKITPGGDFCPNGNIQGTTNCPRALETPQNVQVPGCLCECLHVCLCNRDRDRLTGLKKH